ncbi:MAG: 2-oxoacid:acceptor oxidoreductase family protein [Candidatus Odinarchaeota archaeon]
MYVRVRIAGLGGQGIKLCGVMFGHVAVEAGLDAMVTTQYTPASRGGPIDSSIILSDDKKIMNPFFERPDILCIMAWKSWELHKWNVTPAVVVIYDSDVIPSERLDHPAEMSRGFPFSSTAAEHKVVANMVLLGVLAFKLGLGVGEIETVINDYSFKTMTAHSWHVLRIDPLTFEQSISRQSPERFRENNLRAFKLGYSMAEKYPRMRF